MNETKMKTDIENMIICTWINSGNNCSQLVLVECSLNNTSLLTIMKKLLEISYSWLCKTLKAIYRNQEYTFLAHHRVKGVTDALKTLLRYVFIDRKKHLSQQEDISENRFTSGISHTS